MKSKNETIPEPEQLISFFESVIRLKSVKRAGWVSKVGIANAESVSDHTYSMCMMGMILSDIFGMNTERVTKMILIHDLAESIIGDFMPNKITREKKITEERKAMKQILGSQDIILEILHDLEMNIVKQADHGKSAP